jgi:hypothetical protein
MIFGLDPVLHSLCDLRELCEKYAVDPVFFVSVSSSTLRTSDVNSV